jgi:hypothetical protein
MKQSLSSANNGTSQKMQGHLFWNTPPLLFNFPMIPHRKNKIFWFFTKNNVLGMGCRWGALVSWTPHSKAIILCNKTKDYWNKCRYLRVAYLGKAPTLRTLPYTLFVCMNCNFRGESLVVHWLILKLEKTCSDFSSLCRERLAERIIPFGFLKTKSSALVGVLFS